MAISFSLAVRNARLQVILDALDSGTLGGKLIVYTAPRPLTGAAITTQTIIGTCNFSKPSATIANGVLSLNTVNADLFADSTNTINWARLTNSEGLFVMDVSCGVIGSGADIIFNTLSAQLNSTITIDSGSLTEGNA